RPRPPSVPHPRALNIGHCRFCGRGARVGSHKCRQPTHRLNAALNATPRTLSLSDRGMSALPPSDPPINRSLQPELELDHAQPRFIARRQPQFLSSRSKNAKGVVMGGAALAGTVALGAAACAGAAIAAVRRV